jgi:hypothetical protein
MLKVWLNWKGWRTVIINVAMMVVSGLIWVGPEIINVLLQTDLDPLLPDGYAPFVVLGLSLLNVLLRRVTDTPLGRKYRD